MDNFIKLLRSKTKYQLDYWDPDKFNWGSSWVLAEHCSQHFDIWWDPDRFNYNFIDSINQFGIDYLFSNCLEYFDTWFPAIVERKDSLDGNVRKIVSYVDLALNRPTNESVSQKIRDL